MYYVVSNNFCGVFLTDYLYFRCTPIMLPRKNAFYGGKEKQKTTRATLGVKKEIIAEHENVVCVSELASKYCMQKSTISTFLKNKEMIKAADVAKGSKV